MHAHMQQESLTVTDNNNNNNNNCTLVTYDNNHNEREVRCLRFHRVFRIVNNFINHIQY